MSTIASTNKITVTQTYKGKQAAGLSVCPSLAWNITSDPVLNASDPVVETHKVTVTQILYSDSAHNPGTYVSSPDIETQAS